MNIRQWESLAITEDLDKLLVALEDAYWRLKDLAGDPGLSENQESKVFSVVASLDEFFS